MKTLLTSVLAIATFAIMMTSVPSAFAQATSNVHAVDPIPAFAAPNSLFAMQSISTQDVTVPNANVDIYLHRTFVLYDPDLGSSIPSLPTGANSCENYAPEAGDRLWELRNTATGNHIEASHDAIFLAGSSIFFDSTTLIGGGNPGDGFGNGNVPANLNTVGTATFYMQNAIPALNDWVELNAALNPTGSNDGTSQPGQYILVVCGWVDVNGDGTWDGVNAEPVSIEQRGFLVTAIVGGETMSISTTSLLLAGASVNAFWILPILGLAGTIIAIRKLEA